MKDIISVLIGAIIALIGNYVTNRSTLRKAEVHEHNENKRAKSEIEFKDKLEQRDFDHQIILNNRERIPTSSKEIMTALITLYNSTEKFVANYPGTPYAGTHPSLLFTSTISHLNDGFPGSFSDLMIIDSNWNDANMSFDKVTSENALFISESIRVSLNTFEKECNSIRTYFYGFYGEINSEDEFQKKKEELNAVDKTEFLRNTGVGQSTHYVLKTYEKISALKDSLKVEIVNYTQKNTGFGKE